MDDEPEREAHFAIMGPNREGFVWAISTDPADDWRHNLGPVAKVAEVMFQWLGSNGIGEVGTAR